MDQFEPEAVAASESDRTFGKSATNAKSERGAIELLVSDGRFQVPDNRTKKAILALLSAPGDWSYRTFDAVMTTAPVGPITTENLGEHFSDLRLIEVKATKKPIQNAALNGFFFGATKREYDLAAALGDQFLFAFVVLSSENDYGRPFFVLLTLEELERRTRTKRIQFQVNLGSKNDPAGVDPNFGAYEAVIAATPEEATEVIVPE